MAEKSVTNKRRQEKKDEDPRLQEIQRINDRRTQALAESRPPAGSPALRPVPAGLNESITSLNTAPLKEGEKEPVEIPKGAGSVGAPTRGTASVPPSSTVTVDRND